jgi:hypothetical protein
MGLQVPENLALEEFALTSIENLLLSLYVYHEARGLFPKTIDVISWEFKRKRFVETLNAINRWTVLGETWNGLEYFPVGDLRSKEREFVMENVEESYNKSLEQGLSGYYDNPKTIDAIARRDVHKSREQARQRYAKFPLPF